MRNGIGIGLVSAVTIIGGGLWARAQQVPPISPRTEAETIQELAGVISGNDIGFRIESWDGENPVGRLVVRRNGKWVEIRTAVSVRKLTSP